MCREVFELVKKMDLQTINVQLALQCAPLLVGLKPSNLLPVRNGQTGNVQEYFKGTAISCYPMYRGEAKTMWFLYRREMLCHYLADLQARKLLGQCGYADFSLEKLFAGLSARYGAYMKERIGFPHEIGLLLGYPPEDVRGFLENNGENFLCIGYWKVYARAEDKLRLFHMFDRAKELLLRLAANGVQMREILM